MLPNEKRTNILGFLVTLGGGVPVLIGVLGLLGWSLKLQTLTSFGPGFIPIASSTCIAFLVQGTILILHLYCPFHARRWPFVVLAAVSSIFGMLTFAGSLANLDLTFERKLFSSFEYFGPFPSNLMSPLTGMLFWLAGSTLLLLRYEAKRLTSHLVSSCSGLIAITGLTCTMSYIYGTPLLYEGPVIPIALPTSIAFMFLGCGLLAAAGLGGVFLRPLMDNSVRAVLLRTFVPLGFLAIIGSDIWQRFFTRENSALTLAASAVFFGVITVAVIGQAARRIGGAIDTAEAELIRIQEELGKSRDELDLRVRQRTAALGEARDALRQERDRLQALIDSMADEVWFCDVEGNLTLSNPAILHGLGFESREEWGRPFELIARKLKIYDGNGKPRAPENSPLFRSLRGEVLVGGNEAIRHLKTGELRYRQYNSTPVKTSSGEIIGAVVIVRDVTEQKRIVEALRLDETRFEALYKLSQMTKSSSKEIIEAALEEQVRITGSKIAMLALMSEDERVSTIFEWSSKALAECEVRVDPTHKPVEEAGLWAEAVRKRKPLIVNDYSAPSPHKNGCPEGHIALIRLMSIPIFDGDRIVALALVGNKEENYSEEDVRQVELLIDGMWKLLSRKQIEDELKVYVRRLEQSNRELEEFAFIASHDLQEPLRKIALFADRIKVLQEDNLSGKVRYSLERIEQAALRMRDLVQSLLKYSRVTGNTESFSLIDLRSLVEEAVKDLEDLGQEAQAQVDIDELPTIEGDGAQLRQLFLNLIDNAIKCHGNDKPHVKVYADKFRCDGFEAIHIEDNGIGFDMAFLDKMFKPFQRVHGKDTPYHGSGMGLAICRRIVERHGGNITARSEPGKRSVFSVKLPRRQPGSVNREQL